MPLVGNQSQATTRHQSLHHPIIVQQPHAPYCPNAPLTASEPAVAPAPKIAALPNFLPTFLSHSPCLSLSAYFLSTILGVRTRAYMGMVRMSRMIWVFRILSILLRHLRWLSFVGHVVMKRFCDLVILTVDALALLRSVWLLELDLAKEQVIDLLRGDSGRFTPPAG